MALNAKSAASIVATAIAVLAGAAGAVVNPALQPIHLFERYNAVLACKVTAIDADGKTATMKVARIIKGKFGPAEVALKAANDVMEEALDNLTEGQTVVAFVGTRRSRHELDLCTYSGQGKWQVGVMASAQQPGVWNWLEDPDADDATAMFGTFNGDETRLVEMMQDMAAGTMFFPPIPFTQFSAGTVIDTFDKSLRGVALYDIDGDGKLDIYACSDAGNRAYLQTGDLKFTDATEKLGLAGITSVSCSFADVNGDGTADLLAGGAIYLAGAGGFAKSELLGPDAGRQLKSSAFVEINGDGYPDVVVSRENGGLAVYLNSGAAGGPFTDATKALGLDTKECGTGLNGFFAVGDWNGDRRTDIFYAAGKGLLLVQDGKGVFQPVKHDVGFNFQTGGDEVTGLTGAGIFAPIWRQDAQDIVVPTETEFVIASRIDGQAVDVAGMANEISEASYKQLLTVAEDLNADGYVDIYTTSWSKINGNTFHTNRGYGSFMRDEKYKGDAFPCKAHGGGAWGVAAGDVNGDGANDLLVGGVDGTLTLMINQTLDYRKPSENPIWHDKKLQQTGILTVRVTGSKGVLGATVALARPDGLVAGRRDIGSNVATGCRGPDTVNLAVREPGQYVLTVRYSDGQTQKWDMDLSKEKRVTLEAKRQDKPQQAKAD